MIFILALFLMAGAPQPDTCSIERGYDQMYNLEFARAHRCFGAWEKVHPDDPLGPVSNAAAYLFSEFDRLHILQSEFFVNDNSFFQRRKTTADPKVKQLFLAELDRSQKLAEAKLQANPNDANALFATVLRFGIRGDYLALIEREYLSSLDDVKKGRELAQKLLSVDPTCYDAYIAAGVENYLLSLKPAPLRFILRVAGAQTDKELGIKNLRLTAARGHYLKPYAKLLLAVAALRDNDKDKARELLSGLATQFPQNRLYQEELAKIKK